MAGGKAYQENLRELRGTRVGPVDDNIRRVEEGFAAIDHVEPLSQTQRLLESIGQIVLSIKAGVKSTEIVDMSHEDTTLQYLHIRFQEIKGTQRLPVKVFSFLDVSELNTFLKEVCGMATLEECSRYLLEQRIMIFVGDTNVVAQFWKQLQSLDAAQEKKGFLLDKSTADLIQKAIQL